MPVNSPITGKVINETENIFSAQAGPVSRDSASII